MLTKPRLSLLVIITAAGGWWVAPVYSNWETGVLCVLGTTLTVWSANVFNNYLERDSDIFMARTKTRPLPSQRMKPIHALLFGILLSLISIPLLTLLVNPPLWSFGRYSTHILCFDIYSIEKNLIF